MRVYLLASGICLASISQLCLAQDYEGFKPVEPGTPLYVNFFKTRNLAYDLVQEARPRLAADQRQISEPISNILNHVSPYAAMTQAALDRCGTNGVLADESQRSIYICPMGNDALSSSNQQFMQQTAQWMIMWAHRKQKGRAEFCADGEFTLAVMSNTKLGIQSKEGIQNTVSQCPGFAQYLQVQRQSERVAVRKPRKSSSPSWAETILGGLSAGAQRLQRQNEDLDAIRRQQQQREDRQADIERQRMYQVQQENAAEEARRDQWQAQQYEQQRLATQQAAIQAPVQTPTQPYRAPTQGSRSGTTRPAPVVRSQLSHEFAKGGIDGTVVNIIVYAVNLGNVPIDCDVWLKGAFWNERAGPAMAPDQALSTIQTQRRNIIALKPGERRQAMALSHFVAGSRFDYDSSCKVSFTYN